MKQVLFALACAVFCGFGCGGAIGLDGSALDDDSDIGVAEQAINIGNGGYGFANTTSQSRCAQPGVSGQTCFANAVNNKVVGYCFSGFTSSEESDISGGIEFVDGQVNWTFTKVGFPCDIAIQKGGIATGGGAVCGNSFCIEQFVKLAPTGTFTVLTSPAGITHVNGNWTSFTKSSVVVDVAKLALLETSGSRTANLTRFGEHIAALHIGLGAQNSAATRNLGSDRSTFTNGVSGMFNAGLSAGEVCRANNNTQAIFNQLSAVTSCATN